MAHNGKDIPATLIYLRQLAITIRLMSILVKALCPLQFHANNRRLGVNIILVSYQRCTTIHVRVSIGQRNCIALLESFFPRFGRYMCVCILRPGSVAIFEEPRWNLVSGLLFFFTDGCEKREKCCINSLSGLSIVQQKNLPRTGFAV